jgi:hypothetical protein
MESAGLLIARPSQSFSRPSRCGRFSRGIERDPETPAKLRVGRFSDGIEQDPPDTAAKLRVGRFCTGIERVPDAATALRVGSFADGYELITRGGSDPR